MQANVEACLQCTILPTSPEKSSPHSLVLSCLVCERPKEEQTSTHDYHLSIKSPRSPPPSAAQQAATICSCLYLLRLNSSLLTNQILLFIYDHDNTRPAPPEAHPVAPATYFFCAV